MTRKYGFVSEVDGTLTIRDISICDDIKMADYCAKAIYGDGAYAIDIDNTDAKRYDIIRDGVIYHVEEDGTETEVEHYPDTEELIAKVQEQERIIRSQNATIDELTLALADLIGGDDGE